MALRLSETKRVVIVAEQALEEQLLDEAVKLGAKGWTLDHCSGKGKHTIMEDPFAEPDRSRVRIEILCTAPVAEAILHRLDGAPYNARGVLGYMDTVMVSDRRTFA